MTQNVTPQGYPAQRPRLKFPEGLIIGPGPANKSCFLEGAHPNPGPAGSTPPNGVVCNENRVGASKQKLFLGVGLLGKI